MHPKIKQRFRQIIRERCPEPATALEVGGLLSDASLLRVPELGNTERHVLNLSLPDRPTPALQTHEGNSNDMAMFEDHSFDLVMSNAVLEHDLLFWKSIEEMRRVLAPGGLMVIGVPGFAPSSEDTGVSTQTFKYHHTVDYYRFSEDAVTEFFFDGLDDVQSELFMSPIRIIASGFKPA